jgi:hypothetical protein
MGCCLGRYSTPAVSPVRENSRIPMGFLRTGDIVLFADKREKKLSFSYVGVVVFLPTIFPNDPVLILECADQVKTSIDQPISAQGEKEHNTLVDKLTNRNRSEGEMRLVSLTARLQQLPKDSEVLLKLVHYTDSQLEIQRRKLGSNGVAGGFNENTVLAWINQYQNQIKTGFPAHMTFDFLRHLGISETTSVKRLDINAIAQGKLIAEHNWSMDAQFSNIQLHN